MIIIVAVAVVIEEGFSEAGIVWDARCLTLDELAEEG